jgi:hypothetical protein
MKHGSKIKYAGHYFMHEKTRYENQSVLFIKNECTRRAARTANEFEN